MPAAPPAVHALLSVLAVSAIPLILALLLPHDERLLRRLVRWLVCFAVGALLGAAFLHLIPEAIAHNEDWLPAAATVLIGFLSFFVLERHLWTHQHAIGARRAGLPPLAALNVFGDGAHNLVDGMAIAAAYLADPSLGLTTTVAVLLHEVPQEIGDYGVLLHAGLTRRRAIGVNLLSAIVALLGAMIVLLAGPSITGLSEGIVPFSAGGFIYIAAADLIPQLKEEPQATHTGWLLLAITLGILITSLPLLGR